MSRFARHLLWFDGSAGLLVGVFALLGSGVLPAF